MTEKTMDDVLAELRKASMPVPAIGKGAARFFVWNVLCSARACRPTRVQARTSRPPGRATAGRRASSTRDRVCVQARTPRERPRRARSVCAHTLCPIPRTICVAAAYARVARCAGTGLGSLSQMMGAVARKRSEGLKDTAELKASFVDPRSLPGRGLVVAGRAKEDDAEAESLEREVSFLQSEDISQRRAALSRIMLLAQNPETPSGVVSRVWEAVSLELMKLMSDPVERIRDMAMRSLIAFLDRVTAVAHVLPVAVPCLLHRMGTIPTEEPAEEVRLLLVLVLSRLISLLPKNISAYMEAIQTILECALVDVNPAVRKEACVIIVMLCRSQRDGMRKVFCLFFYHFLTFCCTWGFAHNAVHAQGVSTRWHAQGVSTRFRTKTYC
jgi:hypothetical protein